MSELEITAAVIECVARGRRATSHQQRAMAEFVLHLQYWRDWPQEFAEEVGRRAMRTTNRDYASVLEE